MHVTLYSTKLFRRKSYYSFLICLSVYAVICPILIIINNGDIEVTARTPGETATYSCNDGYRLEGNATRTCQVSGDWSGQQPECIPCTGTTCDEGNDTTNLLCFFNTIS